MQNEAYFDVFKNTMEYLVSFPVVMLKTIVTHPGKALVSFLALQAQMLGAFAQSQPFYNNNGVGVQNQNGNSKSSIQYNPYSETYTARYQYGRDNNHVYVQGQVHDSFHPSSASVQAGFSMETGAPKKRK